VRSRHPDELAAALTAAGVPFTQADGTLHVDADPELVGRIAHQGGVPLVELRDAGGTGLEEMFLQLTADTRRDGDLSSTTAPEEAVA
jgi:ABC-2 type transport system ATP-binding protein